MTKHTPGPWRLVHHGPQWSVCDTQGAAPNDGDHFIADLYRGLPRDAETVEANARLISAAPELLWFAEQIFNGHGTGMIQFETPADETLANILKRGRKALDKAKGLR